MPDCAADFAHRRGGAAHQVFFKLGYLPNKYRCWNQIGRACSGELRSAPQGPFGNGSNRSENCALRLRIPEGDLESRPQRSDINRSTATKTSTAACARVDLAKLVVSLLDFVIGVQVLEDCPELRELVRQLGRGGGKGPLRRAPEEVRRNRIIVHHRSKTQPAMFPRTCVTRVSQACNMFPVSASTCAVAHTRLTKVAGPVATASSTSFSGCIQT